MANRIVGNIFCVYPLTTLKLLRIRPDLNNLNSCPENLLILLNPSLELPVDCVLYSEKASSLKK